MGYECGQCGKKFRDTYALRRHTGRRSPCAAILETDREADEARPHRCKYCQRGFATKASAARHMRNTCKIANTSEGAERLFEHTVRRLEARNAELQSQVSRITTLLEKQALSEPPPTTNIYLQQVIVAPFNSAAPITIPVELVRQAFAENPRLVEYCHLGDKEQTNRDRAAPFVLEAFVDLVRRVHQGDPATRNVYLNPQRADQVLVCVGDPQRWEARLLADITRALFDSVAANLNRVVLSEQERGQLPLDAQSAAAWLPIMYQETPEQFVQDGRGLMAAHLQNTRPRPPGAN